MLEWFFVLVMFMFMEGILLFLSGIFILVLVYFCYVEFGFFFKRFRGFSWSFLFLFFVKGSIFISCFFFFWILGWY